jgi:hypothetical protein
MPWTVGAATTGDDGTFRLPVAPHEARSVVARARGYRDTSAVLAFRDGDAEPVVTLRLESAPVLFGDVHDEDGRPVRAQVVACERAAVEVRTTSGEDGAFELPASAEGCPVIAFAADGSAPSDPVTATASRRVTLRLRAGGAIEGVVVDERGAGVRTYVIGIESFTPAHAGLTKTGAVDVDDVRGAFRFEQLPPGRYVFTASAPGRAAIRSEGIVVAPGATTKGVRIVMRDGGSVMGHVYDDKHVPLAGVDLSYDAVSSVLPIPPGTKSDETGRFLLDAAPAGPFTLRAHKDGFRALLVSGLRVDSHGSLTQDVILTPQDHGGGGFEFAGIGATLAHTDGGLALGSLIPGQAAERAGLRAGDAIRRIDADDADSLSIADAVQRLRGAPGTSVGLSVVRPSTGETIDVLLVRTSIVR